MTLWNDGVIIIGCRHNTAEFIEGLQRAGRPLAGIVTISKEIAAKNAVPTWVDLAGRYREHLPVYVAHSYNLADPRDREVLQKTRASLGFCVGWQRLLPGWFLGTVKYGVFGMHSCQFPLPRGKGRSPINWSLIHGADTLLVHVFQYNEEADSGTLLETIPLTVLPHDTIHTLQQKCRVLFSQLAERSWEALLQGEVKLYHLQEREPELFYPKRTFNDGRINWRWPVRQIVDWVRAQTRPYPGAFCLYQGQRYAVWRAAPFGLFWEKPALPGTILERFEDGTLVIQGGDAPLHLFEHEIPEVLAIGERLSCD